MAIGLSLQFLTNGAQTLFHYVSAQVRAHPLDRAGRPVQLPETEAGEGARPTECCQLHGPESSDPPCKIRPPAAEAGETACPTKANIGLARQVPLKSTPR